MPKLIKNRQIVDDSWLTLTVEEDQQPEVPAEGAVIVPVSLWLAKRDTLLARTAPLGLLVDGDTEPEDFVADLARFQVIAIHFAAFADGRGYSLARLLRERHGYTGELRAVGDILRDQLFYLARCGFDAFAIRPDRDPVDALASLNDFAEVYQTAVDQQQPLFRRRARAQA